MQVFYMKKVSFQQHKRYRKDSIFDDLQNQVEVKGVEGLIFKEIADFNGFDAVLCSIIQAIETLQDQ